MFDSCLAVPALRLFGLAFNVTKEGQQCTTLLDGEIEIVARLADQGLTCAQICRTLNRSRGAVWNALKRLGYPRRNNVILSVELAPNVSAALTAAANRRRLKPDQLAAALAAGVLERGSIEKTIAGFFQ